MRHSLLLALAVLLALPATGQEQTEYAITPEEEAAYALIQSPPQFVKAREAAEAILEKHPDNFVALHVLAFVHEWGEANLPRAYFHASRARAILERRWGLDIPTDGPWRWHARVLRQLISITRQMDREREALELLALRDRYYDPDLTVEYGWPLMKLGRMAEARAKMAEALQSKDADDRLTALNTWGAIEDEAGNAEESYRIFTRLVEEVRASKLPMEVTYLRNLGEAAEELGRFDEAERHFREAVRYFDGETYSNPWEDLSILYMRQGRYPEALSAVREMHAWAHANPPYLDQQSWADRQSITAALLAEAGFVAEGLDLARRVAHRPDRRGGTSVHRDQSEAGQLVLLWTLAGLERERIAEEASWAPAWGVPGLTARRLALAHERWLAGRRAASLVVAGNRLGPSLRFFAPGGVDVLPWLTPGLVSLVGAGVAEAEAARLLQRTDAAGGARAPVPAPAGRRVPARPRVARRGEADARGGALDAAPLRADAAGAGVGAPRRRRVPAGAPRCRRRGVPAGAPASPGRAARPRPGAARAPLRHLRPGQPGGGARPRLLSALRRPGGRPEPRGRRHRQPPPRHAPRP
ncbi:MAG: tetratricopeptide repeat protein [Thermoanaerobaculaceae bacterium]